MTDPFRIAGPALISFSGGRTSGYMLHEIVRAYAGQLPDDVVVVFANTGKEREETLRFVHECGTRWCVHIRWLEWARREKPCFIEVSFDSASRSGEPFSELIRRKKFTPNSMMRFCTEELKVRVLDEYARSLGWSTWSSAIGLRYDEGHRVLKALARNDEGRRPDKSVMPLARAKITKSDVHRFWSEQPFNLMLRPHEGNCDLCFMKGARTLASLIRERPESAAWWIEQEKIGKGSFRPGYSYADLLKEQVAQGHLFDGFLETDEHDTECGLHCSEAA